jgi:hypothetical protein
MRYLFLKLVQRYAQWILGSWAFFVTIELIYSGFVNRLADIGISSLGYIVGIVVSIAGVQGGRWPAVVRRTSQNIKQFWIFVFGIYLITLLLNGACYLLVRTLFEGPSAQGEFISDSPFHIVWIATITLAGYFTTLFDIRETASLNAANPSKQFWQTMKFFAAITISFGLYFFSNLLGYAFFLSFLLITFFLSNSFIKSSLQPLVRVKAAIASIGLVITLLFSTYAVENKRRSEPSKFLGKIGPKKSIPFSDLEKAESPSQWFSWLQNVSELTSDQVNAALEKLEKICPPTPADDLTVIECFQLNATPKSLRIESKSEENDILKRLNSNSEYVRLLGLVSARGIDTFSTELAAKIDSIKRTQGRLSLVAERTLYSHKSGRRSSIQLLLKN